MRRVRLLAPVAVAATVVLEIAVFLLLAQQIGAPLAILAVLTLCLLGAVMLRREGIRAWRGFRDAARAGRAPGVEVTDGLLGLIGGLLLSVPGFITAALGLLLAIPPVRRGVRHGVQRRAERQLSSAAAGNLFGPRRVRPERAPTSGPVAGAAAAPTIEGEVV